MSLRQGNYRPEGDPFTAKYVFVGEAPGVQECIHGRPFFPTAPSGAILEEAMQKCGIPRSEVYLTNVFDHQVSKDKKSKDITDEGQTLFSGRSGYTAQGMFAVERLRQELRNIRAHAVFALGAPALTALTGKVGITKHRGSVYGCSLVGDKKVVATFHPANALHNEYINRYMIAADMRRYAVEAGFPELRLPQYQFDLRPTLQDIVRFCRHIITHTLDVSVDIENPGGPISRICLAISATRCLTIGFQDYSAGDEAVIWIALAEVLEHPQVRKIFQNCMHDMVAILAQMGIRVRGPLDDTMVMQRILYPDFKASLAFLCSLYTDQPYYKDMVKHGTVDKEDG